MPGTLSFVEPVELVGSAPMLRLPRTTETAALEGCVPARVGDECILVSLPDETFPVGTMVEGSSKRGILVIRRYRPRDDSQTRRASAGAGPTIAWRSIPAPHRWDFSLGSSGFELTVVSRRETVDR